jgi:DNA polymerase III psi subunit
MSDQVPRYHAMSDLAPSAVEQRVKKRLAGESSEHQDTNLLLVEILAQQVAARRHLLLVAVIAMLGVAVSAVCAIVIAVQVTHANTQKSCTGYSCY